MAKKVKKKKMKKPAKKAVKAKSKPKAKKKAVVKAKSRGRKAKMVKPPVMRSISRTDAAPIANATARCLIMPESLTR